MSVSENFSFAKLTHPPHRCGRSRYWLNCMITAQVCLLPTIKGCSKMCSFIAEHNSPDDVSTCNHTSPGPPRPASSPPRWPETSHADGCYNKRFADISVVDGGVMVWASRCYGQRGCVLLMAIWMNRDTVTRSRGPLSLQCCCCCTLRYLICKPAQPTSGSRWKRNPVTIDPFLKSNLMKIIKAEQTLTWNASWPRHRCARGQIPGCRQRHNINDYETTTGKQC